MSVTISKDVAIEIRFMVRKYLESRVGSDDQYEALLNLNAKINGLPSGPDHGDPSDDPCEGR